MRVQEADDVPTIFFAGEDTGAVEFDAGGTADRAPQLADLPQAAAALADERPAFFAGGRNVLGGVLNCAPPLQRFRGG
jgi:hypothetical protein